MAAWRATTREGLRRVSAAAESNQRSAAIAASLTALPDRLQGVWRTPLEREGASAVGSYRTAVEFLAEVVLASRQTAVPPRTNFRDLMRLLRENHPAQDSTVTHLDTIRTLGNAALHGQSVGEDEAAACRIAGQAILKALGFVELGEGSWLGYSAKVTEFPLIRPTFARHLRKQA